MQKKNQHTVPRAYLSLFVDPATPEKQEPFVWVHERGDTTEPYRRAPHKVAVESYYYSFKTPDGEREDVVEEFLSRAESAGMPVLRDLASGREPADLSGDEKSALAFFIGLLEVRVPRYRQNVEQFTSQMMRDVGLTAARHPEYFRPHLTRVRESGRKGDTQRRDN